MGFFGLYLYDGSLWSELDQEATPSASEPWLLVRIYDSDITEVSYAPLGPGSGVAFLGYTPRLYFEDETASAPTDPDHEAQGLATWWAALHPEADEGAHAAKASELKAFLASDDPSGDDEDEDDEEVLVEVKTARFVRALGLPTPAGLPG